MSDSIRRSGRTYQIVVVGTSLGGIEAIRCLLGQLSESFSLPIIICQHRGTGSDDRLENLYRHECRLEVVTVEDKLEIRPGFAYLTPPGYHTLIGRGELSLSTEEPVSYARPSIDVLFESAADAYRRGVIGVLMTGASHDGAAGLAEIKRRGGTTIVQNPESAEAPIMPRAAIEATDVDFVLDLQDIGPRLNILTS